jgi:predicted DNA-binding transcriptional regulator AlpA
MSKDSLPEIGFLRLKQIIGDAKAHPKIPPLIPISRSAWYAGIKSGRYPKPIKISQRTAVWNLKDIINFIESAR